LYGNDYRRVEAKGGHRTGSKAALEQTVLRNTTSTGKIDGCKENGIKLLRRITDGTLHLQSVLISSVHVA
jgi:hypothetical protein